MLRALAVLAILATSLLTNSASAQSAASAQDKARSIGEEGLTFFGEGQWQEAYNRFHSAEAMFHAPTLVLYMARCNVKLGQWVEARELYRSIENDKLPTNASAAFANAKKEAAAELATLLPQIPVLVLEVRNAPESGARIRLDGREVAPQKLRGGLDVDPGKHVAQIFAEGRETATYPFETFPGRPTRVAIPLVDKSQEKPGPSGPQKGKPASRDPFERVDPLWLGLGAGATVLAASAGVVGVVVSNNASSELDAMEESGKRSHEEWDDANGRRVAYTNLAFASLIVGGVAAISTGTYLGLALGGDADGDSVATLTPTGPGLGGLTLSGRW